jgi:hypothetical protein
MFFFFSDETTLSNPTRVEAVLVRSVFHAIENRYIYKRQMFPLCLLLISCIWEYLLYDAVAFTSNRHLNSKSLFIVSNL